MGIARTPLRVLPIVALFSRHSAALDWAAEQIERTWGPIGERTDAMPFACGYYEAEMGVGLQKQLIAIARPADPAGLVEWKHTADHWERAFAAQSCRGEARPLNIDPGYVTEAKVVLASTKDRDHRVYLDRGIYAEVTLAYRQRRWQARDWTYPDYRQAAYLAFFDRCRAALQRAIEAEKHHRRPASP